MLRRWRRLWEWKDEGDRGDGGDGGDRDILTQILGKA